MVSMYLDGRVEEEREERRHVGMLSRLPGLMKAIADCRRQRDFAFRGAIAHWLRCVTPRISNHRPQHLKLPDVLRQALGLAQQSVLLEKGDKLWMLVDGHKTQLLYEPYES